MTDLRFVETAHSKTQLSKQLESGDLNLVCEALLRAAQHQPDWRWSQAQCLSKLRHECLMVRACALVAIGKIAIFRSEIDLDVVLPELRQLSTDPALAPFVESALREIEHLQKRRSNSS